MYFILRCVFFGLYLVAFLGIQPAIGQDYSRAKADSLTRLLAQVNNPELRFKIYFDITRTYWRYQPDSTIRFAEKYREEAEAAGNKVEVQKAVNVIGYMLELKGQYAESWKFRKLDERLSMELGDSVALAFSYYGLGNLSTYIGNYPEALDYHMKALRIREKGTDKYQLGWSYTNVGYVYSLQGLSAQAIEYRQKALDCFSTPGILNVRARDNVMRFLAEDYIAQKEYPKALEMYTELLAIKRKRGDPMSQIAYTEEEIGWVLFLLGRNEEAITHYERALLAMRSSDVRREPLTLNRIAKAYLASGRFIIARETASRALQIGRTQNRPDVVSESQWILAEEAEKNGRLTEAIGFLKQYWALRDSIFSSENQIKVAARETAYEVEKKQREIERLEQQNQVQNLVIKSQKLEWNLLIFVIVTITAVAIGFGWMFRIRQQKNKELVLALAELQTSREQLAVRNTELERLNREKDYFFSIIGHDLRNPFNAIIGFSGELRDNHAQFSPAEVAEIASRLHGKAVEVMNLLGNLLEWSRLELGAGTVTFEKTEVLPLVEAAGRLFAADLSTKKIRLETQIPPAFSIHSDPNIIAVVVRNLLSNAIKFSFSGGEVQISAQTVGQAAIIEVTDFGIGMSPAVLTAVFSQETGKSAHGTWNEAGTGLGLMLCRRYAEKIGATLTAESQPGIRTTFRLSIPT